MLTWLAQASGPDPTAGLASLGVIAVALVMGAMLVYRFGLLPERARADRLEEENKRLNEVFLERAIPALVTASDTMQKAIRTSTRSQNVIDQLREQQGKPRRRRPVDDDEEEV